MEQSNEPIVPGYMTFREAALLFSLMQDEDAAKAIKATVNYFLDGTITELEGNCIIDAIECARTDGEHNGFIVGVRFLSWLMANLQGGKES